MEVFNMKNKIEEKIFRGVVSMFIKKGLQATTQEVAKEEDVAEVTLYRRYSTKENLFTTVIQDILERKFHSQVLKLAEEEDTEMFLTKIIKNRLELLSINSDLIKMLLSECLRGNLKIDLPDMIFTTLKKGLDHHFQLKNQTVDIDFCARQLGGVFLSYVMLPNEQPIHQLSEKEKENIARRHALSVMSVL